MKTGLSAGGEDIINGSCGLTRFSCYGDWLSYLKRVRQGREPDRVPAFHFPGWRRQIVVGIIDIRLQLTESHYYSGPGRPDCGAAASAQSFSGWVWKKRASWDLTE